MSDAIPLESGLKALRDAYAALAQAAHAVCAETTRVTVGNRITLDAAWWAALTNLRNLSRYDQVRHRPAGDSHPT